MVWGTIIALYLFLAGLSAGGFLTSVYIERVHHAKPKHLLLIRTISLIALAVGLMLLIYDAPGSHSNPRSLLYLLHGFKTSVMSWGVLILAVSGVIQLMYVIYDFMRGKNNGYTRFFKAAQNVIDVIGVIFGFGVAIYTGLLLGVVQTAPLWNNALLPILFLVSAISVGIALTQFIGAFVSPYQTLSMNAFNATHAALLLVEATLMAVMLFIVNSSDAAGAESVSRLLSGDLALLFWGVLIIGGLLFPAVLEFITLTARKQSHKTHLVLTVITEVLVLIGGVTLRYLVVHAAVPVNFVGF